MHKELVAAATVLAIIAVPACSSHRTEVNSAAKALSPGAGQLTIGDHDHHSFGDLKCTVENHITTLASSQEAFGITAMLTNIDTPTVKWVRIRGNGFAGSYNQDLGGNAEVTLIGSTYHIAGTASGFKSDHPGRSTSETFVIDAQC